MTARPSIQAFFDDATGTVSYVIADPASRCAAVVDPVLDFDLKSGRTGTVQAQRLLEHLREQDLTVQWILETHAHADHLSAAHWLQQQVGGRIAIGEHIREVQATFRKLYNLERGFLPDGSQFDHLFQDGEAFHIGELKAQALLVPGHTPADMAYVVGDAVFVGDTLFMPDVGTARADFPGGDARTLYASVQRILAMPPQTRVFVCHDYPPTQRAPAWESTVADQRAGNIHVRHGISEQAFIAMRQTRDATLDVPTLILPSIQVNIRAGRLPAPEDNGVAYLRIPLNALLATHR
ncbi:MBL fold metallo-hydrolase [Roseateles sp. DC23W]|uniref:MBL fold metallo-hydrolase n=1 Tax=Pelomonas dachongensis TaxID=3299029 RepID=A0ABW7ETY4_9BURK